MAAVTEPGKLPPGLGTNGLEAHTTRTVSYPGQGEIGPATCSHCGYRAQLENSTTGEPTARWEPFSQALDEWMAGQPAMVTCPQRRWAAAINDWQWAGDGTRGRLPWLHSLELAPAQPVMAEVGAHLGQRVVFTQGKL